MDITLHKLGCLCARKETHDDKFPRRYLFHVIVGAQPSLYFCLSMYRLLTWIWVTYNKRVNIALKSVKDNTVIRKKNYQQNWVHIYGVYATLTMGKHQLISPPTQNGRYFADGIIKCIFLNWYALMLIINSLKFILKCPINNFPALVQIMAWRRPGDKPLSEPMMIILLTHVCVARLQCVNVESTISKVMVFPFIPLIDITRLAYPVEWDLLSFALERPNIRAYYL